MPTLLYCDVDGVDRTFELGPNPILIGRATDCQIRSDDPRMSRQHARIFYDGQTCWIEDLWDPLESTCRHASLSIL